MLEFGLLLTLFLNLVATHFLSPMLIYLQHTERQLQKYHTLSLPYLLANAQEDPKIKTMKILLYQDIFLGFFLSQYSTGMIFGGLLIY